MIKAENQKLLDRYLMICMNKGLTERTIDAKKTDLELFLRFIGDKHIEDITHIDCDDFLMHCRLDRKNGDWALSRKHSSLSAFFDTLIQKEYINIRNPMNKVDPIKVRHKMKDYLTPEEMDLVFSYLEQKNDLRGLALISLFYSSACRISEVRQLNRADLDMENRSFRVIGKGQEERSCFFSEYAKQNIVNYLNSRADALEPLFISRENNRWSKEAIEVYVKNLIAKAGINKHITPHSFRHSVLTNLRREGARLEDLQLLAGHKDISTTQRVYTHVGLDDIRHKFDDFHNKI